MAADDELGIVAMFVISPGIFVDNDDEFQDIPQSKEKELLFPHGRRLPHLSTKKRASLHYKSIPKNMIPYEWRGVCNRGHIGKKGYLCHDD